MEYNIIQPDPPGTTNLSEIERKKCRDYKKEVAEAVERLRGSFEVQIISRVTYGSNSYPIFLISSKSKNKEYPNVFISAGMHGNEPAGVYALLEFFQKYASEYQGKVNLFAVPCINPSGFESDTRETQGDVDINRDFLKKSPAPETNTIKKLLKDSGRRYLFSSDMHEETGAIDPENPLGHIPEETYFYESSVDKQSRAGASLVKFLEREGIKFCKVSEIYEEPNDGGVVLTPWHGKNTGGKESNTFEDLLQSYTQHAFTTETPTKLSAKERKQIQIKILRRMLDYFLMNGVNK